MTGLDSFKDTIIEIACVITDGRFNAVDKQGFESVIYKPDSILDNMNEWCISHHGSSGLTAKVREASPTEQSLERVEEELLAYIKKYVPQERVAVLGGNSVHADRFFMAREFPKVIEHLHYRIIDVLSFTEVMKRLNYPLHQRQPRKVERHTAKLDILESIEQMKWVLTHFLKTE